MKKFLATAAAFIALSSPVHATPITLNVHDADLKSTIMFVARAGNLNVSVDDSVGGNISISLSNVEPRKILEIIAKTKNLNLVQDGEIFIMTSQFSGSALMNSYLLPIKFGDAETLRKAVVMSLDPEPTRDFDYMTRRRNSDGSYSYRYSYDEKENSEGQRISTSSSQKISRDERVLISPDVNALILYGTQAEYERAKNLLALLDVELKQVSLEARIVAIDKNASKNLGVEWFWSALPQYPERETNSYQSASGAYRERVTYNRNFDDSTGYGILRFGRGPEGIPFEFYYGARINALVTDGKAKILSRPNVTTIQGHEAIINVGSAVPVPKVSTNNTSTTTLNGSFTLSKLYPLLEFLKTSIKTAILLSSIPKRLRNITPLFPLLPVRLLHLLRETRLLSLSWSQNVIFASSCQTTNFCRSTSSLILTAKSLPLLDDTFSTKAGNLLKTIRKTRTKILTMTTMKTLPPCLKLHRATMPRATIFACSKRILKLLQDSRRLLYSKL